MTHAASTNTHVKAIIIFGSSRSTGNTMQAVEAAFNLTQIELIDIAKANITLYDYEHRNAGDDFIAIAEKMSASNIIIFATPVYWYAMSGQMKMFFDRITDLMQIRKDVGRSLKGKKCYLITSGTDPELPSGFEESFSLTCKYFEMEYKGAFYYHVKKQLSIPQTSSDAAREFGRKILNST